MLQARLLLLAILVPAAGVFALLGGTSAVHGAVMAPYELSATTAGGSLSGAIARFANETVDTAARAASDADVIGALAKKQLTPKAEAALLATAGGFGPPTFALLVAPDGTVIARAGTASKLPDNLKGLPVVAESLSGVARDGMWRDDDGAAHLAAAASYDGASVVGGVVLGWAYSNELVASLARLTQLPFFVLTEKSVVGKLPEAATAEELRARTPFGEISEPGLLPVLVPDRFRYSVVTTPLYAADTTVVAATVIDRDDGLLSIKSIQLGILGVTFGLGLLILVVILTTLRAVTQPIDIIVNHLGQLQQGNNIGILPEAGLSGPFLRLGKQINAIVQTLPAMRPGTAPLGSGGLFGSPGASPLGAFGSTPPTSPLSAAGSSGLGQGSVGPSPLGSFPGSDLGSGGTGEPSGPTARPPRLSSTVAPPGALSGIASPATTGVGGPSLPGTSPQPSAPSGTPSGPAAPAPASGLAGLFDEPDPLAAFRVPPKPSAPTPPSPPPAPAPQGFGEEPAPQHEMNPEATVMFQVPESLLAAAAQAEKRPAPAPQPPAQPPAEDADDNRTVVAQVPKDLLSQAAGLAQNETDAADQAHYKEVYEKFVQTRVECAEDTSDLSFDRFVAKLLKNRQQILEKHKAKGVRFQVYVKDGKAALRALPVRE